MNTATPVISPFTYKDDMLDVCMPEPDFYSCRGVKGGRYELLGEGKGAGTYGDLDDIVVYMSDAGQMYYRSVDDFNKRMYKLPQHIIADRYFCGSRLTQGLDVQPPVTEDSRYVCRSNADNGKTSAFGASPAEAFSKWRLIAGEASE